MNEQEIIEAEKVDMCFTVSELCDVLMDGTFFICLFLLPTLLLIAALVYIAGGNVSGVFLGLFIVESVGWTLFGLFALLRKHCIRKVREYGW